MPMTPEEYANNSVEFADRLLTPSPADMFAMRAKLRGKMPDWGWQRAMDIYHNAGQGASKQIDGDDHRWIDRCLTTYREYQEFKDAGSEKPMSATPLSMVIFLWECPEISIQQKWNFEAHILAGQSNAEIADFMNCSEDDVEAFVKLSYNIREMLDDDEYIWQQIFAPLTFGGMLDNWSLEVIWKLAAYFQGPEALEMLMVEVDSTGESEADSTGESEALYVAELGVTIAAVLKEINAESELNMAKLRTIVNGHQFIRPETD